jgi:CheY-like chemotaxis protein
MKPTSDLRPRTADLRASDSSNLSAARRIPRFKVRMTLSALLVCANQTEADVLRRVLNELNMQVESCPDLARATMRAAQQRFDVVIVDGGTTGEIMQLLEQTRQSRPSETTMAVVVVPSQESVRELFSLGVNFVLYKPVAYERALSSLSAARALLAREKRKDARASVHAHARIDYANVEKENATLVNLSQSGMAVQFGKSLPPTSKVYFQYQLPGQSASVRLSGHVVWQDWTGRGGVQFVDVPKASRRLLEDFLKDNLPSDAPQGDADLTVEMKEPVQVATLSVHEQSHAEHAPVAIAVEVAEAQPQAGTSVLATPEAAPNADPSNRRTHSRYTCRVGAEVYRSGKTVPTHCSLTDLGAGGCYLEVPLPYPQGSPVEIVVRTHDMKLHLHGKVQASHPGFGMGIAFELNTKEEFEAVKKLTDFVAATATS